MCNDLRYALRMLRKSPGFTAAAMLALALGIGANTAIFSVVNSVLLRPLAYKDAGRLVWVWETEPDLPLAPTTSPDFLDWKEQNHVFEQLEAYTQSGFNLTGVDRPARLQGATVTPGYFRMLGAAPALGRDFAPGEDDPARNQVIVLSHGCWTDRFGSDPKVVGRVLTLDDKLYTVIGVMPREFAAFPPGEYWVPFTLRKTDPRGQHFMWAIGKLKQGVTRAQGQAEMETITRRLQQQYPVTNTGIGVRLIELQEQFVGRIRPSLIVLLGAVGFVLLIACANVANLLLARAVARRREMALRTALGAGRFRLLRQMLAESSLLSLASGGFGIALAWWGLRVLKLARGANIPRLNEVALDTRVLGFTLMVSALTGLLFGLLPAIQGSRVDLNHTLKETGATVARRGLSRGLGGALVVAEVALSLMLAIGSGLMIKSFLRLTNLDLGFEPRHVLTTSISLPRARYKDAQAWDNFYRQLEERVRALPGVEAAATTTKLPVMGGNNGSVIIEGQPLPKGNLEGPLVEVSTISPDYFPAMGIPLKQGRWFNQTDTRDSPPIAVINETMARKFWPNQDAVGKRFSWDNPPKWIQVAGVVADVRQHGLERVPLPETYHPFTQGQRSGRILVIRTVGDPRRLKSAMLVAIQSLDKDLPTVRTQTMEEVLDARSSGRRFQMTLFTVFAVIALVLACIGIYSVLSYSVSQQRHEIGIRMALGARRSDVQRMVVRQAMLLAVAGVAAGAGGAWALSTSLRTLLFDVKPTDPGTIVGVSALLLAVAVVASFLPARRAAKVDPILTLRYE